MSIPPSNPQEPSAQAVNEKAGFFVSDAEWTSIKTNCDFDYIVIGSGFCALAFIHEIIQQDPNATVLCLERGGNVLPTHLQNLRPPFTLLGGKPAETYHWALSRETYDAGHFCRGLFPFFGGRSTIWSACCPQPTDGSDGNPDELRQFPKFMLDMPKNDPGFWLRAKKLLRVVSAADIKNGIFGDLQCKLDCKLGNTNVHQIPGGYKSEPTHMSVGPRLGLGTSNQAFNLFSVPGDLLSFGPRVKIRLNCPVSELVDDATLPSERKVVRINIKGEDIDLPLANPSKTKIILANSPIPIATLLLNSFPHMSATVGKRFLGHFLTLLVARVPKSAFGHSGTSLQYGANYIGGQDPTTKLKYHLQVIAVNSPNPEKDADDLLRECPDYTTAPTAAQLKGSEEYVVVAFASHAEMTEKNDKNWLQLDPSITDKTCNILLQYLLSAEDEESWNFMDEATYKAMQVIAGEVNAESIEYWHGTSTEGVWLKTKPDPKDIRISLFFHEASTAYASENPGIDGGSVDANFRPVWHHGGTLTTVNNVYVTGAALFPTIGSWNPTLTMTAYTQALARKLAYKEPQIITKIFNDTGSELLFFLPRPTEYLALHKLELLKIAGFCLSFEILPPWGRATRKENDDEAVFVIWGEVNVGDKFKRRPFSITPATKCSARLPTDTNEPIRAGTHGAIYLRIKSLLPQSDRDQWQDPLADIPLDYVLDVPGGGKWSPTFNKYAHLPPSGCPDDGLPQPELWNLSGIAFRWASEPNTQIGHFQFWTCKKDTNCGVHNHENENFCEIHMGLSPGTGNGMTRRVKAGVVVNRCRPNDLDGNNANFYPRIHLGTFDEQGGFWDRNADGTAVRRPNKSVMYPYHGWKGGSDNDGLDVWISVEYNPDVKYP